MLVSQDVSRHGCSLNPVLVGGEGGVWTQCKDTDHQSRVLLSSQAREWGGSEHAFPSAVPEGHLWGWKWQV